ncbi:hypothetical protein RYX36_027594 [Vicia faba]
MEQPQQQQQQNDQENGGGGSSGKGSGFRQSSTRWTPTTDQIRILKDLYYNNGIRSPSAEQIHRISARLRQYGGGVVLRERKNKSPGQAFPLGVSQVDNGINFAIFSQHATAVSLCLVLPERESIDTLDGGMIELALDPHLNKTGDVWHICIEDLPGSNVLYGYQIDGSQDWGKGHQFDRSIMLVDPYAKLVEGRRYFGDISKKLSKFLGTYDPIYGFIMLLLQMQKDLVIYEMNVRAFTMDESSGLDNNIRGSYLGVIEKIPHLLELGINAVELLPIFEFDELELQRRPNPRDHMINTWGYSTINFFAPMSRYASAGGGPVNASQEFKQMVKALHSASIEVILDVVYNHTNEADDPNPYTTSFRGIDNKVLVGSICDVDDGFAAGGYEWIWMWHKSCILNDHDVFDTWP